MALKKKKQRTNLSNVLLEESIYGEEKSYRQFYLFYLIYDSTTIVTLKWINKISGFPIPAKVFLQRIISSKRSLKRLFLSFSS